MSTTINVVGVAPYDGSYEFDPSRDFTTREWGWIKRMSGYLPLDVETGFEKGDPELIGVLAVVMMFRSGKIEAREVQSVFDRILDAPFGSTITIEGDEAEDEEDDAGPPVSSSNSNGATSGAGSATSSATPETSPPPTGLPGSATSASASTTLAT